MSETYEQRRARKAKECENAMCVHMKALVAYCREHRVFYGGCGDCSSPWLTCKVCNEEVGDAADVFYDEEARD